MTCLLRITILLFITLATRCETATDFARISRAAIGARAVTVSSKAGLAWPNGNTDDISQFQTTGKVSWYYTWSAYPVNTNLEFVPMLWGGDQAGQFASTIYATIANDGVKAVLGMNEPDQGGQSNLTPQQGAQMWQQYLEPLRSQGVQLGSPATSSAPAGKQWILDFLGTCGGGCTVDFIAIHWYGVNSTEFTAYLEDFHDTFQRPIWVTEWTCQNYVDSSKQCSQSDIVQFMKDTQGYMDTTDWVERYTWFGAMTNLQGVNPDDALLDKSGNINALGEQYIGGTTPSSSSDATRTAPHLFIASLLIFFTYLYLVVV